MLKPINEFGISRHALDGHNASCKECARAIWHEAYKNNTEKMRNDAAARQRAFYKNNPEAHAAIKARFISTEKGQLWRWTGSVMSRLRKIEGKRTDGRARRRPGGDITATQLRKLWQKQDGRCVLTGRKMLLRAGKQCLDSPSVDRTNPEEGYTMSNIRLVTYQANMAKAFGTDEQLREFCRAVLSHGPVC
jgi:hypothetical protein